MKKINLAIIMLVVALVGLAFGCGKDESTASGGSSSGTGGSSTGSSTSSAKVEKVKPVELIFTTVSVTGDAHTEAMYVFADRVEELSGGTVKAKIYDNGALFSADGELDAVMSGDADIAYISFPVMATQIPSFSMFGSGYFFSSYEHMTSVLNGDTAKEYIWPQVVEELDIVPLGSMYLGSRVVNTRKKAVNSYDDMKGVLLRMPNTEAWLFLGEALGANPTPLAFSELYTALQTGAVDGQDNPLPTIESAKFYEVTEYIAITNHVVDSIAPCINGETWRSLTADQQTAVQDAMTEAIAFNDAMRIENENSKIAFFEDQGLTVTYPSIDEFRERVQAAYANNTKQTASWDMDLYNKIQALAK